MEFQTKIPLKKQEDNPIDYNSKVMLFGSCFAENIGNKFEYYKFQNYINPLGILFHPLAIQQLVTNALNGKKYIEEDVFFNNEQFHCFEAHSKLSNPTKSLLLHQLNASLQRTNHYLKQASHVIITLGTAWIYRFLETNQVVANCHKVSQKKFQKELLSIDVIKAALLSITEQIKAVNPEVNFIFTVSPVRHIKDGFVENTQSKSHLISAIHQVLDDQSCYFPSFEIMMDQLRDYRFYQKDMLHPNDTAVQFIWERFKSVWIDNRVEKTMDEVAVIQKGLRHISFNANSNAHLTFLEQLEERQIKLTSKFPNIKF